MAEDVDALDVVNKISNSTTRVKTKPKSRFFDLPAELRDKIYDLVIQGVWEDRSERAEPGHSMSGWWSEEERLEEEQPEQEHSDQECSDQVHTRPHDAHHRLALVSRQFRKEYLARRYKGARIEIDRLGNGTKDWNIGDIESMGGHSVTRWVSVFGDTRAPLITKLLIWGNELKIRLTLDTQGAQVELWGEDHSDTMQWVPEYYNAGPLPESKAECREIVELGLQRREDRSTFTTAEVLKDLVEWMDAHDA